MKSGKNLFICDADSILYSTSWSFKDKSLEEAIEGMDNFIDQIADLANSDAILLCLTKGPNWRASIAKSKPYKGNRKYETPIHYLELKAHMIEKYKPWIQPGFEADDLIFIAREHFKNQYNKIILGINDKDCLQYPGIYLEYKKMQFTILKESDASLNFWTQMIVGDPADNIGGLEGAGPKFAEKLFKNKDYKEYYILVFNEYIKKYGEKEGIVKFYESYMLLKLLESREEAGIEESSIPKPLEVNYGLKRVYSRD